MKRFLKKVIGGVCVMSLFCSMAIIPSFAADDIRVNINGQELVFDVPPQIIDDYTMVPMRTIFEVLGYTVDWNADTKDITAKNGNYLIIMTVNENHLFTGSISEYNKSSDTESYIANHLKSIDKAPQIVNGRTLVPVRVISEASGYSVEWDSNNKVVNIYNKLPSLGWYYDNIQQLYYVNSISDGYDKYSYTYSIDSITNQNLNEYKQIIINKGFVNTENTNSEYDESYINKNGSEIHFAYGKSTLLLDMLVPINPDLEINQIQIPTTTSSVVSYDDVSENVNQIKEYINQGQYLEAIDLCNSTKENYRLSQDDISIIDGLSNEAQQKYNEYVEKQKEANKNKVVTDQQKQEMFSIIKTYVSHRLKSPSTAIWPEYDKVLYWYTSDGRIMAIGSLEAMNGFGGYGKVSFTFTFNEDLSVYSWFI